MTTKQKLPEISTKRYKLNLCSDCYQVSWCDDDGNINSNCKCVPHDDISQYVYYQGNKEDEREDSHTARYLAIAFRLKHALTLDLDGLESEIDDLIKELEEKKQNDG